jgi:hypothetical protein
MWSSTVVRASQDLVCHMDEDVAATNNGGLENWMYDGEGGVKVSGEWFR